MNYQEAEAYIIYKDTVFFEKRLFGYAELEDANGKLTGLVKFPKSKMKRYHRHALISCFGKQEVVPGWGIIAGNISGKPYDQEEVDFILDQEKVEYVLFTLKGIPVHAAYKGKNVFFL